MSDPKGAAICLDCENMKCPSKVNKELVGVNLWNQAKHNIFAQNGRYYGECTICGHIRSYVDKQKLRYPQLNASTGEIFKSREEEKAYAKKNGLTEMGEGRGMVKGETDS